MNITVRFFSISKELAGSSQRQLTLPEQANVQQAVEALYSEIPSLKQIHAAFAIGLDYADKNMLLKEGDTISVIPPVQGG